MRPIYSLLTLLLLLASCAGSNTPADPPLSGKMNKAARSLQELLPYLYNRDAFADKKNRAVILKNMQQFKASIHDINSEGAQKVLGDDPYVLSSLNNLHELTDRSLATFQKDDLKTSRILLKATTNTCFKCHTRQTMGAQSLVWTNFNVDKIDTDPIEKAHLLVAMRQYEEAKLYLSTYLTERETAGELDADYETGLHYYMMVSLRGQKTFESTLNFIKAKTLLTKAPTELNFTLKHWHKDLSHWTKNANRLKPTIEHARGVLKRNGQRYSQRNLINNLVASSLLHQFLMGQPKQTEKAKAYSVLGQIYDELVIEGFWDLPEVYYEMCVRYSPKTELAKGCYRKLHNNITLGYSGSRGTLIPAQEYARLETLRKMAGL